MTQSIIEDINELRQLGIIDESKWNNMSFLVEGGQDVSPIVSEIRELHLRELEKFIENEIKKEEQTSHSTDTFAAVSGGMFSLFNTWNQHGVSTANIALYKDKVVEAAKEASDHNKSIRKVGKFKIVPIYGYGQEIIITINGFLTEGSDPNSNWSALPSLYGNQTCFNLEWESGSKDHLEAFRTSLTGSSGSAKDVFHHLNTNPWKSACLKSESVGTLLAKVLRQKSRLFKHGVSLMGHSLGGAIIFHALKSLESTGDLHIVKDAFFFGAAVTSSSDEWAGLLKVVQGRLCNVYNANDQILSKLFNIGTFSTVSAAGTQAIDVSGVQNIDVSNIVPSTSATFFGHSYGSSMKEILELVKPSST